MPPKPEFVCDAARIARENRRMAFFLDGELEPELRHQVEMESEEFLESIRRGFRPSATVAHQLVD